MKPDRDFCTRTAVRRQAAKSFFDLAPLGERPADLLVEFIFDFNLGTGDGGAKLHQKMDGSRRYTIHPSSRALLTAA